MKNYNEALNELQRFMNDFESNVSYMGKDANGSVIYSIEPGYDIKTWLKRMNESIDVFKKIAEPVRKSEEIELLEWIDAHPATTNRLAVITTKSGIIIQLREGDSDPTPGVIKADGIKMAAENLYDYINGKGSYQKATEE